MQLLLDFANVVKWDFDQIKHLYEKYKIGHNYLSKDKPSRDGYYNSLSYAIAGHIWFIEIWDENATESSPYFRYSLFTKDTIRHKIENNDLPCDSIDKNTIFPEDAHFKRLYCLLEEMQHKVKLFLNRCTVDHLNIAFLNECIKKYDGSESFSCSFSPSQDQWRPTIEIKIKGDEHRFWNYIIKDEILNPFIEGNGHQFSKIKVCKNCNKYFVAKTTKAIFCSTNCRASHHYATSKDETVKQP